MSPRSKDVVCVFVFDNGVKQIFQLVKLAKQRENKAGKNSLQKAICNATIRCGYLRQQKNMPTGWFRFEFCFKIVFLGTNYSQFLRKGHLN